MIENKLSNVASAFEMLLEEVEAEIDFVNTIGSRAFENRDYQKAKEALERSASLTNFRDRIASMRREWEGIAASAEHQEDEDTRAQRKNLGKLRKGVRTPESAYFLPILRVLSKMGGKGKVAEVVDAVGEIMKSALKKVDYEPLASNPDNPRWRNATQWARNSMVQEGLLRDGSPRGIWEITDKGKAMLKEKL